MSTMYLSVHDLLRITYTYEARAVEEVARSRSNSDASSDASYSAANPNHASPSPSPSTSSQLESSSRDFSALETDFTYLFARKKRDSCVSMT
ncbi:hypothetical protein K505DRAFT_329633 [Melanomma pulvis-pyrius CBS 109.77]|uniref:Uncharacterized protein n=1 Tax=Melanomma pulvis-pyrius CBS 109.77 TaxID=1314802 RepID=A0A6A6WUV8_9PLEO|nr:hypothetical protein K505DRAFT_329633 [Melanomma pulvis-pyrius CBS 109.77]